MFCQLTFGCQTPDRTVRKKWEGMDKWRKMIVRVCVCVCVCVWERESEREVVSRAAIRIQKRDSEKKGKVGAFYFRFLLLWSHSVFISLSLSLSLSHTHTHTLFLSSLPRTLVPPLFEEKPQILTRSETLLNLFRWNKETEAGPLSIKM